MRNTVPLKPSTNDQMSFWVAQGDKPTKAPGTIKNYPFKALKSPRKGWPPFKSFGSTLGVGLGPPELA
jgi:hypothetical protein